MKQLFTADFETTTQKEDCRVWAWATCDINEPDNIKIGNTLKGFIKEAFEHNRATFYFHNLKFDGEFIISYLLNNGYKWVKDRKELNTKTFTTLISDKGVFYSIEICNYKQGKNFKHIKIYDSMKLLPFSVSNVAKAFDLPISKLEIDYEAYRAIGHILTEQEREYIKNDVKIMALALKILFNQGLTKMTIGSNALADYKKTITEKNFERWFPVPTYDADIRQAYKGGYTYLNDVWKCKNIGKGIVLDVNSLYPSVMYYNPMPYGEGIFFEGKYVEDSIYNLYVQMIQCRFELKKGYIPTIQLKHNLAFIPTEYLKSSGDENVTICLTSVDLELFLKHYNVYDLEYLSGWKFKSTTGLFKDYIDYWNNVKVQATIDGNAPMRTLAKLMLNNLYGKFALNPNVQSKIPYLDNGIVKYKLGEKEMREPIYIPVGCFITAFARYKTITSAQTVFDRFVYADTDSLHLIGTELPKNLEISDTKLGAWKHESSFTRARFLRQKSYIECETDINGNEKMKITCAGMPPSCYKYVTWDNFYPHTQYQGKLKMTHTQGGIILADAPHTLRE